jgi:predicted lipid-binding transport protein (Tim44 family)
MIGLIGLLPGEILYEAAKFIIMLLLLVCAFFIGSKWRMHTDAKKEKQSKQSDQASHSTGNDDVAE